MTKKHYWVEAFCRGMYKLNLYVTKDTWVVLSGEEKAIKKLTDVELLRILGNIVKAVKAAKKEAVDLMKLMDAAMPDSDVTPIPWNQLLEASKISTRSIKFLTKLVAKPLCDEAKFRFGKEWWREFK